MKKIMSSLINIIPVSAFFALRVVTGMVLLSLSAKQEQAALFVVYSQFFLAYALLNLVTAGCFQSGIIREIAKISAGKNPQVLTLENVIATGLAATAVLGSLILCICTILKSEIAVQLVGNAKYSNLVMVLVVCSLFSALGQMGCAILTGFGRSSLSLTIQGVAITIATASSAWGLLNSNVTFAVSAFAIGGTLNLISVIFIHRMRNIISRLFFHFSGELLGILFRNSGSYILAACAMPITLFILRPYYSAKFGVIGLSDWLLANRISDFSSQFIGIYMSQIYLHEISVSVDKINDRNIILKSFLVLFIPMSSILIFFYIFSNEILNSILLSKSNIIKDFILLYLLGDIVRILPSMMYFTCVSKNKNLTGAGLELINSVFFIFIFFILMSFNYAAFPAYSYIGSNFVLGIIGYLFLYVTPNFYRNRR